jgi:hypothetical protein
MGLPSVNKGLASVALKVKPPIMRVVEAAHLVDKNARTEVKLCQLTVSASLENYQHE